MNFVSTQNIRRITQGAFLLLFLFLFLFLFIQTESKVRILTDNGPQGGDLEDVKKLDIVIAGVDQVAGATLFGMKGNDLGYVRLAAGHKFGVMDLSRLNIKKISV